MITHGNKQISEIVYARKASEGGGAVRLTNIIRGAQVVFGGLYPFSYWLNDATRAAILAAFGQDDGYAVLGATNAYLNAIAATDQTKASALAVFINEDPMLVCSIGLQPQGVEMPIRFLINDGASWVDSNIIADSNSYLYIKFRCSEVGNNVFASVSYSDSGSGSRAFGLGSWNLKYLANYGNYRFFSKNTVAGETLEYTQNKGAIILDWGSGRETMNLSGSFTCKSSMIVPGISRNGTKISTSAKGANINVFNLRSIDNEVYLVPFISKTRDGMVDLVNAAFHPNQGTGHFTDAYTLQDGVTPWTPLNQTP